MLFDLFIYHSPCGLIFNVIIIRELVSERLVNIASFLWYCSFHHSLEGKYNRLPLSTSLAHPPTVVSGCSWEAEVSRETHGPEVLRDSATAASDLKGRRII